MACYVANDDNRIQWLLTMTTIKCNESNGNDNNNKIITNDDIHNKII